MVACLIPSSSIISSEPPEQVVYEKLADMAENVNRPRYVPGIAYARTSRYKRSIFSPCPPTRIEQNNVNIQCMQEEQVSGTDPLCMQDRQRFERLHVHSIQMFVLPEPCILRAFNGFSAKHIC